MVKGCERRVVIYKSKDSRYFTEAHFILKDSVELDKENKRDIIDEANRIVRECSFDKNKNKNKKMLILRVVILIFGFVSGFFAHLLYSHVF